MRTTLKSLAAAVVLAALATPANASVRTLILGDFDADTNEAIRKDLIGSDTRFDYDNSASYDLSSGLPDFDFLQKFDSVLVYTDRMQADITTLSDLLGKYVDAGGGVVIGTFRGQESSGGLLNSTGYNPFINVNYDAYQEHKLGEYDRNNPLMAGVNELYSSIYNADYLSGLDKGATLVASWDDGSPLAAYNLDRSVFGITLYPNVVTFGHAQGDYQRLFANGLALAADRDFRRNPEVNAVPEPAAWALTIVGFAVVGAAMRRRTRVRVSYA